MHPVMKRVVDAYRPLHHHGLLRDGCYPPPQYAATPDTPRRRGLLIALASLLHITPSHRNKA